MIRNPRSYFAALLLALALVAGCSPAWATDEIDPSMPPASPSSEVAKQEPPQVSAAEFLEWHYQEQLRLAAPALEWLYLQQVAAEYLAGLHAAELERARRAAPPAVPVGAWDRLAGCESGGRWNLNALHDGGLQFHPGTWTRYRLPGYPAYAYQASREQQIAVAVRVRDGIPGVRGSAQGWRAWPSCTRKLGYR